MKFKFLGPAGLKPEDYELDASTILACIIEHEAFMPEYCYTTGDESGGTHYYDLLTTCDRCVSLMTKNSLYRMLARAIAREARGRRKEIATLIAELDRPQDVPTVDGGIRSDDPEGDPRDEEGKGGIGNKDGT